MRVMTREDFFKAFKNQSYVEQLKEIPQKFNVVHDEEIKTTNITIYGIIGYSWMGESFSSTDIDNALNEAGTNDIVINLNSPGGDAFAGIAIYNRLKRHEGKVTVHVDGWACSAASLFPAAADETIMGLGSMLMIHQASSFAFGTKVDMRKEADVLEELEEGNIDIYMTKANVSREEIREKVDAETWFNSKKAVEIGFATRSEGTSEEKPAETSEITNSALNSDQKQEIINELKGILKPNNQQTEAPVNKKPKRFL